MKSELAEYLEYEIHELRNTKGIKKVYAFIRSMLYSPSANAIFLLRYCYVNREAKGIRKLLAKHCRRKLVNRYGIHFNLGVNSYIGRGLFLPHPCSIIFGEGVCLGKNCIVYQNVTFGAKRRNAKPDKDGRLYPIAGDNCIFYAGAVVIGPIHIGNGTQVGANSVLITGTENDSIYAGVPAIKKGKSNDL